MPSSQSKTQKEQDQLKIKQRQNETANKFQLNAIPEWIEMTETFFIYTNRENGEPSLMEDNI